MPAEVRGHVRKLPSGKWQLRYYDRKGGALIDTARQCLLEGFESGLVVRSRGWIHGRGQTLELPEPQPSIVSVSMTR